MNIAQLFSDLLFDYTLRTVALGAAVLGIVAGALGGFAVLRKQSLLGDAMSHAALPGIALAFLITRAKTPLILVCGAAIAGWIGTLVILAIIKHSRIKYDSALGMVLSVFFGFGLVLLTFIQRLPDATQAGLDTFLFGRAAALMAQDVVMMSIICTGALTLMLLFWKEFKLLSFDPEYGASLGFTMNLLDVMLTTLLVIAIAIGLQTVGVVLMSAMIVAPAAAARQWTDKLGVMILLAALFGALAGVSGAVISSSTTQLPTGPTIVLCISAVVTVSLLFAPNRGVIWRWVIQRRNRQKLRLDLVLENLYALALQHDDPTHAHETGAIRSMVGDHAGLSMVLRELERRGWVSHNVKETWNLTPRGLQQARDRVGSVKRSKQ